MPTTYIIRSRINGLNYAKKVEPIKDDPNPQVFKWVKYNQEPTQFEFMTLATLWAIQCGIENFDTVPYAPYNFVKEPDNGHCESIKDS